MGNFFETHAAIFWGAIAAICVIPALAHYACRWRKTDLEADLKYEMIQRGMSADEIERVLAARMGPKEEEPEAQVQFDVSTKRNPRLG